MLEGLREALQQYWEAQAPAHLSESPRLGGRAPGLDAALPRRRSRVASELETMAVCHLPVVPATQGLRYDK